MNYLVEFHSQLQSQRHHLVLAGPISQAAAKTPFLYLFNTTSFFLERCSDIIARITLAVMLDQLVAELAKRTAYAWAFELQQHMERKVWDFLNRAEPHTIGELEDLLWVDTTDFGAYACLLLPG
ncbi:hypothetical protein LTR04_000679 [Oleoguttula sp. CCFEE 6159]|nr:hypothetical protein LTR04_000679 [Oleoguttula sp. CCFEE 6159]